MLRPASKTKPVLSNTPFGRISVSYSIHSALPGDDVAAKATLAVIDELLLLQIDTVATENVVVGQV
jgi:hypothetical protein